MADNVLPVGDNRYIGLKSVIEQKKQKGKEDKPSGKKKQKKEEEEEKDELLEEDEKGKNGSGSVIDLEI